MRLYFKIRDIENLDLSAQKAFIKRYVEDVCHLERCGVEIETFIEHYVESAPLKSRNFIVGSYQVRQDADFPRIELKMKLFNVHDYFVIFAIL
jgi:hypothetical protein